MTSPVTETEPKLNPIIITASDMQATVVNSTRTYESNVANQQFRQYGEMLAQINEYAQNGASSMPWNATSEAQRSDIEQFLVKQGFTVTYTPITYGKKPQPWLISINWKKPQTELNSVLKSRADNQSAAEMANDNKKAEKYHYLLAQINRLAAEGLYSTTWDPKTLDDKTELVAFLEKFGYTVNSIPVNSPPTITPYLIEIKWNAS